MHSTPFTTVVAMTVSPSEIKAYFEPHIEQGPILEDTDTTIGVVIGGLGQKWFDLTLTGLEAHAGPTPMNLRRDAMMGAAEVTQALNKIALDHQPHGRGTVGCMSLHPGSRNVIPGQVKMTLDMRHWEPEALIAMGQSVTDGRRRNLPTSWIGIRINTHSGFRTGAFQ